MPMIPPWRMENPQTRSAVTVFGTIFLFKARFTPQSSGSGDRWADFIAENVINNGVKSYYFEVFK
jgi:hypothetical protein